MTRLFINQPISSQTAILISQDQLHYLKNVLKCRNDNIVYIYNDIDGEWKAKIHGEYLIPIAKINKITNPSKNILIFSPTKNTIELIIEKATALNVRMIIPILTTRSIVTKINYDRLAKIIIKASQQCGRMDLPTLHDIMPLKNSFDILPNTICKVVCGLIPNIPFLDINNKEEKAIFIGPEGDFTSEEMDMMINLGILPITLGPLILRAETAAIIALAQCQYIQLQ